MPDTSGANARDTLKSLASSREVRWLLLGASFFVHASARVPTKCEDKKDKGGCVGFNGCKDCPCKWMGEYNMGCRSCSAYGDCDEDRSTDGLHTLQTVLIVVFAGLGVGLLVLGAWCYMRRKKRAASIPSPFSPAPASVGVGDGTSAAAVAVTGPTAAKPAAVPEAVTGPTPAKPAAVPAPVKLEPMRIPSYWQSREGVNVVPDPSMMAEVQKLMSETWKVKYTRDRKIADGSGVVPSGCRVVNVLRVEHHSSYDKTWRYKQAVRARRHGQVERFATTTTGRLNRLEDDINEVYLFHGTSPQAADAIARSDFRISKAGSSTGMMFGPGIYLAENSSKSDEYAKEGEGVFVGQYAMLICRAVAGRVLTVTNSGDYSARVSSQEYDSVCGDRLSAVGTFREMVFFQEEAVYAEYIAIYVREYE